MQQIAPVLLLKSRNETYAENLQSAAIIGEMVGKKREMQALPGQIEKIEAEIRDLHATMADPSFYKRDRAEIAKTNARLEELEKALAAAYERWEVLERAAG